MEYIDIVKSNNKVLYISIPKKQADLEGIKEGDTVRNNIEKIGGGDSQ